MQPLQGVRVLDMATLLAGPETARYLADFGADVIKVEPPAGDGTRRMGWTIEGDTDSLMWKLVSRNKRSAVLDLKSDDGLAAMRRLCAGADVLVENLRPGRLEGLGLAPDSLLAANPGLVILRVTGFGQDGPYADRPGFATLAEAMSGFAAVNGEPDGAPLLPPTALADEVTGLVGAFAVMVALRHAERTGEGQVVDVNLLESMLQVMGPLVGAYAHLGYEQPRLGAGIPYSVPRGTYRCADGTWVAVSTSAESVARRVMELVGLGGDPRFETFPGREEHRVEIDAHMRDWIGARDADEVLEVFVGAQAAIAPVYTMADIADDPHLRHREALIDVEGLTMQGLVARFDRTPGRVRHAGRALGVDTQAVLDEITEGRGADATSPEEGG